MLFNKNTTIFFAPFSCQEREGFTINTVINTHTDISNNIDNYNKNYAEMVNRNDIYNNDILDSSGNLLHKNTLRDAIQHDIQTLLIQENTMYIVGIITTASLIIAAILISK